MSVGIYSASYYSWFFLYRLPRWRKHNFLYVLCVLSVQFLFFKPPASLKTPRTQRLFLLILKNSYIFPELQGTLNSYKTLNIAYLKGLMINSLLSKTKPCCMSSDRRKSASESRALAATIESQKEKA